MKSLSLVLLCATPWTVAYQAPPSMGFSRQECWSGLSFPSPGDLPNPGIEPGSPALQADALPSEPKDSYISFTKCQFSSVAQSRPTLGGLFPQGLKKKNQYSVLRVIRTMVSGIRATYLHKIPNHD